MKDNLEIKRIVNDKVVEYKARKNVVARNGMERSWCLNEN